MRYPAAANDTAFTAATPARLSSIRRLRQSSATNRPRRAIVRLRPLSSPCSQRSLAHDWCALDSSERGDTRVLPGLGFREPLRNAKLTLGRGGAFALWWSGVADLPSALPNRANLA